MRFVRVLGRILWGIFWWGIFSTKLGYSDLSRSVQNSPHRGEGDPGLKAGAGPRRTEGRGTNPVPTFPQPPGFQARVDQNSSEVVQQTSQGVLPQSELPAIASLLKSSLMKRILDDREIIVHAVLDSEPDLKSESFRVPLAPLQQPTLPAASPSPPLKKYRIYASMLVKSGAKDAYTALTNYQLYSQLVPFIDSATYSPISHLLLLEGGLWNFRLSSQIRFQEHPDRWIHFHVVEGHFKGMEGNLYFESQGEKGTLVYLGGELMGKQWPPVFIIERGAEIVFGLTAQRMRSYIESEKGTFQGEKNGDQKQSQGQKQEIPQPKKRFSIGF